MNHVHSHIVAKGTSIPFYTWAIEDPNALLVFVHGLKSHSGWFLESGLALAQRQIKTYAFDRRGSGVSKEPRGDVETYQNWLDDIDAIANKAREDFPGKPLHILGHCFGAKLALAYGVSHRNEVQSLCLIAPPQQSLKVDITPLEKVKVALHVISGRNYKVRVPVMDDMYTSEEKYHTFIKNDPLRLQQMTTRFCYEVAKLDSWLNKNLAQLKLPTLCLLAEQDDIVDQGRFQKRIFNKLNTLKKLEVYDCRHHLLYEPHRDDVLDRIERWICQGD